jgi:hypothetical protein
MAQANEAYGRGDAEALQRILDEYSDGLKTPAALLCQPYPRTSLRPSSASELDSDNPSYDRKVSLPPGWENVKR